MHLNIRCIHQLHAAFNFFSLGSCLLSCCQAACFLVLFIMKCIFFFAPFVHSHHASCIYLFQLHSHVTIITKCRHTGLLSASFFSHSFSLPFVLPFTVYMVYVFSGNWFASVCYSHSQANAWKSFMNSFFYRWVGCIEVVAQIRLAFCRNSQTFLASQSTSHRFLPVSSEKTV